MGQRLPDLDLSAGSAAPTDPLAPMAVRSAAGENCSSQLGSLSKAYVIWLAGATCEGCSVAVTGGTRPRLEQLLTGAIPGLPRLELVHALLSMESGPEWVQNLTMAEQGELDALRHHLGGFGHGRVHCRRRPLDGTW